MTRRFEGGKLVIASHNPGKVAEIRALLAPHRVETIGAGALGLEAPEETGETFRDNALLKARAAVAVADLPALADDSGLVVPALGGAPGIHSARWAGEGRDFNAAMAHVERALDGKADRTAWFACALALCWPDGHCESFEGRVTGALVWPPRGAHGFGYDPIFVADGGAVTFGELRPEAKHRISHRADAFGQLIAACFGG
jgi:XTP/dITP diphosphohydrolase